MRPIYESLCHSLTVDFHDRIECGHWTVRRLLALAGKDNNAGIVRSVGCVQCGRSWLCSVWEELVVFRVIKFVLLWPLLHDICN